MPLRHSRSSMSRLEPFRESDSNSPDCASGRLASNRRSAAAPRTLQSGSTTLSRREGESTKSNSRRSIVP